MRILFANLHYRPYLGGIERTPESLGAELLARPEVDGIQYLVRIVDVPRKVFVEFGVEDYTEANTRFLSQTDCWSDPVMDGSPREYNALFGCERKVTVPYDPSFLKTRAHYSDVYFGASLAALDDLVRRKGYALVGADQIGNKAFFVRRDALGGLKTRTPEDAYVSRQSRQTLDNMGTRVFLDRA